MTNNTLTLYCPQGYMRQEQAHAQSSIKNAIACSCRAIFYPAEKFHSKLHQIQTTAIQDDLPAMSENK